MPAHPGNYVVVTSSPAVRALPTRGTRVCHSNTSTAERPCVDSSVVIQEGHRRKHLLGMFSPPSPGTPRPVRMDSYDSRNCVGLSRSRDGSQYFESSDGRRNFPVKFVRRPDVTVTYPFEGPLQVSQNKSPDTSLLATTSGPAFAIIVV